MASGPEKRSRHASARWLDAAAILTLALATGCGKGDEAPRAPEPEPSAAAGTLPAPVEDAVPVPLPDDFPPELPVPPGATAVRVETAPDQTGTAASVTLVTTADADDTLSWYARALSDAGWQIAERGSRSLHAVQGESYAAVKVTEDAPGRTTLEARIWKAGR